MIDLNKYKQTKKEFDFGLEKNILLLLMVINIFLNLIQNIIN